MADKKISALTAASTPLAGTEVLPIVQSGSTVKVSVANLTAGRSVAASSATFGPVGNFEDTPFVQQLSGFSTGNQNYYQFRDANGVTAAINAWGSAYGSVYSGGVALSTNMVNTSALGGTLQYGQAGVAAMYKQYDGKHYFYRAAPGTAGNPISFQEVLTTDTNNNVTVSAGNLVVGTAGKGIDFSANANAPGMTSELLDWYEEGTWTPSVGGDATYTVQDGRYTRIGRIVIVQAKIEINVLGTGSVTTISGLPYAASVTPFATTGSGSVSYFGSLATSVTTLVAFVNSGSSTVLFSSLGAAATTMSAVTNVFGNGTRIDFSVAYEV